MGFNFMVIKMTRLIHGFGINDADYTVRTVINGKAAFCKAYSIWSDMIKRCYSIKYHEGKPSYIECSVCDEWKYFSAFADWLKNQDYEGKCLDKDILHPSNKLYSPEKCVFVSKELNNFTTDRLLHRGKYMLGVSYHKATSKFSAMCSNPFTNKKEWLGLFDSEAKAHLAWKKRKHELACKLADLQADRRVAEALRLRYS